MDKTPQKAIRATCPPKAAGKIRYVYIAGAPYSGSTLLTFLLNAHPECVSAGETFGLPRHIDPHTYQCSCGVELLICSFWRQLVERVNAKGGALDLRAYPWKTQFAVSRNRYLNYVGTCALKTGYMEAIRDVVLGAIPGIRARMEQTRTCNAALARAALELTGASVFVDGSKVSNRIRMLAQVEDLELHVIHLVRDVRGGAASIMKNARVSSSAKAAQHWLRRNVEAEWARRHVASHRWLTLRYSDLCCDPQQFMDRTTDFMGVSPAPLPADFRAVEHHLIGNRMRLGGSSEIREDQSWRDRLSSKQLDAIARVAGAANRRFGYDWP